MRGLRLRGERKSKSEIKIKRMRMSGEWIVAVRRRRGGELVGNNKEKQGC